MTQEPPIEIELTTQQVKQVLRQAATQPNNQTNDQRLLAMLANANVHIQRPTYYHNHKLSLSVIQGLTVLATFTDQQDHTINDVSKHTQIPRTTAYRYIRTLHAIDLLELNPTSHLYKLAARLTTPTP